MKNKSQWFEKQQIKQRAHANRRMDEIHAKLQLGVMQVISGIKELPFYRRVLVAVEILFALENRNYNAYGEYIGGWKKIEGQGLGNMRVSSLNADLITDEDVDILPQYVKE